MEYRQLQQQLEFGGTWYQSRGGEYERPYSGSSGWCMSMLLLNLYVTVVVSDHIRKPYFRSSFYLQE